MEKIRDSITRDLPPLRLYLDELREVHEVVSKYCAESVIIETCGYRLADFEELKKLSVEQTHDLYVSSTKPYLRIRLTRTHGEIYVGEGDLASEGLVSRLEKILVQGKTWLPSIPTNNWVYAFYGIPLGLGLFLQNTPLIIIGVSIPVLWLLWTWFYFNAHTQRFNTIIFTSRKEAPNFWKRNRDELIMLAIGTIIGVVITKIIDILLK